MLAEVDEKADLKEIKIADKSMEFVNEFYDSSKYKDLNGIQKLVFIMNVHQSTYVSSGK